MGGIGHPGYSYFIANGDGFITRVSKELKVISSLEVNVRIDL